MKSRYKTFRCQRHNKFFEINLYQKNPSNAHHWRANLGRPARDIDLAFKAKDDVAKEELDEKAEEHPEGEEKQKTTASDSIGNKQDGEPPLPGINSSPSDIDQGGSQSSPDLRQSPSHWNANRELIIMEMTGSKGRNSNAKCSTQ